MAEKMGILGISTAGSAPPLQTRRKYDRSDKILMRAFLDAAVMHIIIQKMQKRGVKDLKYYMFEDDYLINNGTIKGASNAGADAAITTSTTYFNIYGPASESAETFLSVDDKIHIPAQQVLQTAVKGTGGVTDSTVYIAGEDMVVAEICGGNLVRVVRGSGAGTLAGNITAGSGSALNFEMKGVVLGDASSSPVARSNDLEEDYNYREVKRFPWDVSGRLLMQDMYGTPELQRRAVHARTMLFRYMERTFWTNHRYLSYGAGGLEKSHTGGFFEFVADTSTTWTRLSTYDASKDLVLGDGSQRVWMVNGGLSLANWSKYMEKALKFGSRNKLFVAGREFMVALENLLRPYYGSFSWDEDTFGFQIVMVRSMFGTIPFLVEQEFSSGAAGYGYNCACLDMDYLWYVYGEGPCAVKGCGNTNSDIHIHQNIQDNDAAHRKDELFVDFGWDQRFRNAHSWVIWDGTNT